MMKKYFNQNWFFIIDVVACRRAARRSPRKFPLKAQMFHHASQGVLLASQRSAQRIRLRMLQ